jgi:DNA-directed RNA polymerase sigma subunit (sigma70/sigma32)
LSPGPDPSPGSDPDPGPSPSADKQSKCFHRTHRERISTKRLQVRPISQGQYREVLSRLSDIEADMLRYKWGLSDGHVQSAVNTAEQFSVQIDVVQELEARALDMVSEL